MFSLLVISAVVARADYLQYSAKLAESAKAIEKELPTPLATIWMHMEQAAVVTASYIAASAAQLPIILSLLFGPSMPIPFGIAGGVRAATKGKIYAEWFLNLLKFADKEYPRLSLPTEGKAEFEKIEISIQQAEGEKKKKLLEDVYKPASENLKKFWTTRFKLLSILAVGKVCATADEAKKKELLNAVPWDKRPGIQMALSQCTKLHEVYKLHKLVMDCRRSLNTQTANMKKSAGNVSEETGNVSDECRKAFDELHRCQRSDGLCMTVDPFWEKWVDGSDSMTEYTSMLKEAADEVKMLNERDKILSGSWLSLDKALPAAAVLGAAAVGTTMLYRHVNKAGVNSDDTVPVTKRSEHNWHLSALSFVCIALLIVAVIVFVITWRRNHS